MGFLFDETVLKLTVVTAAHIYESTNYYWLVHIKYVNCMLCELYLKKAVENWKDGKGVWFKH